MMRPTAEVHLWLALFHELPSHLERRWAGLRAGLVREMEEERA